MFRTVLLAFAVVLFALLGFNVIVAHAYRWEMIAFASFAASFLPLDDWSPARWRRPQAPPQ